MATGAGPARETGLRCATVRSHGGEGGSAYLKGGDGAGQRGAGGGAGAGGGEPEFVGFYHVSDGAYWGGQPPTYTCREACALVFGGVESEYRCSVNPSMDPASITGTGWHSAIGIAGCSAHPDDWKENTVYWWPTAYSAYVWDNCQPPEDINYCWLVP